MKIIIVNHNGGSPYHGPNLRTYYLAKSLVSRGHQVSVVSSAYSHKYHTLPTTKDEVTFEEIDGIGYFWIRITKYTNLFFRVFSHFQFGFRLIRNRALLPGRADVVLFSGPQPEVFLLCSLFSKIVSAPVCSDVRDLWPLTQLQMSKLHFVNPYVWLLFCCESYMYSRSNKIFTPLPGMANYKSSESFKNKISVISNGCEVSEELQDPRSVILVASAACPALGIEQGDEVDLVALHKSRFFVGYSGSMDRDNDTESFIDAALTVGDLDVTFVLVGDGVIKNDLIRRAAGSPNILFLDKVVSADVPRVLRCMDVLFCGLREKSIYRYGASPAKIYEYMGSAKPVIWAVAACNNPVSDSGCGVSVFPGDSKHIASAVMHFKSMPESQRLEIGKKGLRHLRRNYSYDVLGDRWESELLEVVNGSR